MLVELWRLPQFQTVSAGAGPQPPASATQPAGDRLEEVVVTGVRRSEQLSVDIKRYAPSIQDSNSAEDIGCAAAYDGVGRVRRRMMFTGVRVVIALLLLAGEPDALSADSPTIARVVVCFGDSITAGPYPALLSERLAGLGRGNVEVANEGIGGNRILHDSPAQFGSAYGPAGVRRFQQSLRAHPGARVVIVLEGINDILQPGMVAPADDSVTASDLISGLRLYIRYAHQERIKVLGGTIMPFQGYRLPGTALPPDWAKREATRQAVNRWIRRSGAFDGVIDFDRIMRDPRHPDHLRAAYDSGDHLHPNRHGYGAMANGIDLTLLQ